MDFEERGSAVSHLNGWDVSKIIFEEALILFIV